MVVDRLSVHGHSMAMALNLMNVQAVAHHLLDHLTIPAVIGIGHIPVVDIKCDPTVNIDPELISRVRRHVHHNEHDLAGRLISDDLLDRFAFSGSPVDIIQQAERLFEAGAGRVEFGTPHGLKSETGIRLLCLQGKLTW